MTYVVTEGCINCKHTDCVEICPAQAFHEGPNFVVINPDECIDCDLCVKTCPVGAIYAVENLPPDQVDFIAINLELSRHWPVLLEQKPALEDAESWSGKPNKRSLLERQIA